MKQREWDLVLLAMREKLERTTTKVSFERYNHVLAILIRKMMRDQGRLRDQALFLEYSKRCEEAGIVPMGQKDFFNTITVLEDLKIL